jgi:hypothetical protein
MHSVDNPTHTVFLRLVFGWISILFSQDEPSIFFVYLPRPIFNHSHAVFNLQFLFLTFILIFVFNLYFNFNFPDYSNRIIIVVLVNF